ncbi:hypothetical protein GCM10009624_19680 [Gordonia sinesedis]
MVTPSDAASAFVRRVSSAATMSASASAARNRGDASSERPNGVAARISLPDDSSDPADLAPAELDPTDPDPRDPASTGGDDDEDAGGVGALMSRQPTGDR